MRRRAIPKAKIKDEVIYHPILTRFDAPRGELDPKYRDDPNANNLDILEELTAKEEGKEPPLADESTHAIDSGIQLVDEAALPFYVDAETEDEVILDPLPACIQKTYDKQAKAKAEAVPLFDIAAHENESRMRRLSRESAEREMVIATKKAKGESTELSEAEIKAIGDFYENGDNTLFR